MNRNIRQKLEAFKNTHVGKHSNLVENIKKLPERLKDFWVRRQYESFLSTIAESYLDMADYNGSSFADTVMPFLLELGENSFDRKVHRGIYNCFSNSLRQMFPFDRDREMRRSLTAFWCNRYVGNLLDRSKRSVLLGDDYILSLLQKTAALLITAVEEQTLKLEELELQKQSGTSPSKYKYVLQNVVLDFISSKSYLYPFFMTQGNWASQSLFPKLPGVYFIYYVGQTRLYEGSQVFSSIKYPVYVGMSQTSISERLDYHRRNINNAPNLNLADFVVRFIIVDTDYYAPCIEGMMIEYFSPVWNRETMGLSFGNGDDENNIWNKYHIQEDEKTINIMLQLLKITD